MIKKLRNLGVLGVVLSLILTVVAPIGRVWAEEVGSGDYRLSVSVDSHPEWVALGTVNNELLNEANVYLKADNQYVMTLELRIPHDEDLGNVGVRAGGDSGPFEVWQTGVSEDLGGSQKYTLMMRYEMKGTSEHLSLNPYSEAEGGEPGGPEEPGEDGAVVFTGCDEIEAGCHGEVVGEEEETVRLRLSTLWHMKFQEEFSVNGQAFTTADFIDYDDQVSYLEHYHQQTVGFEVEVAKADDGVYEVVVETERNENQFIGNFLWTADPEQEFERDEEGEIILDEEGNPVPGRNYIGHSWIQLFAVEYTLDGIRYGCDLATFTCVTEGEDFKVECDMWEDEECGIPYIEFDSGSEEYDDGSLVVPAGARVTLQVIPEYGYQVLNVNMAELETRDGVGQFTFTVPGGAAYFVADVVKTEDVVVSESEKVSGGEIKLGEGQTSLGFGSARLQVSDVELDEEERAEFSEAAEGFEVKNYLNISLSNIIYKGTEEEAWEGEVKELNEEAEITLTLEEGVDGNEVVIVHQKSDGSYEVIPAEYDAEARTIKFKTSSFSNYAIASRTSAAPETGRVSRDGGMARESGVISGMVGTVVLAMGLGAYFARKRR